MQLGRRERLYLGMQLLLMVFGGMLLFTVSDMLGIAVIAGSQLPLIYFVFRNQP